MNPRVVRRIAVVVLIAGVIAAVAHAPSSPRSARVMATAPRPAAAKRSMTSTSPSLVTTPVPPATAAAALAPITATLSPPSSLPPPDPADPAPPTPIAFTTDSPALAPAAADATPLPEVALYGDSLTVAAWGHYQDITAGEIRTSGHAYYGMALPDWADEILHDSIDRLVLALGTNDADKEGARPWADLLNKLPATKCVVWPKPYEGSNNVKLFNAQMLAIVAAHPNVHVIDWDSTVKAHPEWVGPDHRHYVSAGSDAYAEMLQQAARTCP